MCTRNCQKMHQTTFAKIRNHFCIHFCAVCQDNSFQKFSFSFWKFRAINRIEDFQSFLSDFFRNGKRFFWSFQNFIRCKTLIINSFSCKIFCIIKLKIIVWTFYFIYIYFGLIIIFKIKLFFFFRNIQNSINFISFSFCPNLECSVLFISIQLVIILLNIRVVSL